MRNKLPFLGLLLASFYFITGCGSAEAIEQYNFPVKKEVLEKAVTQVLNTNTNPDLIWDTTDIVLKKYRKEYKNSPETDTIRPTDFTGVFFWITINDKGIQNHYSIRYLGDERYWKTSAHSALFISAIWNNAGLDLRQGQNVGDFSSADAEKAKALFEKVILAELDKQLNIKHTTGRSFLQ